MRKTVIPFTQEYVIEHLEGFLRSFFNILWGSPELTYQKIESQKNTIPDRKELSLLNVFINQYPEIAAIKGWKGFSLLASAIAIDSWLTNTGETYDEYIVLLSLFKLFTELGIEEEQTAFFRYELETILSEKDLI